MMSEELDKIMKDITDCTDDSRNQLGDAVIAFGWLIEHVHEFQFIHQDGVQWNDFLSQRFKTMKKRLLQENGIEYILDKVPSFCLEKMQNADQLTPMFIRILKEIDWKVADTSADT